jgi:GH18 family chitinase
MYQMPKEKQNNFTSNPTYVVVPVAVREEENGDIVRTNPEDSKRTFVGSYYLNKQSPSFKINNFKLKPNVKEKRGLSKNLNNMLNKRTKVNNYFSITENQKKSCVGSDKVPFDFGDLSYISTGDWDNRSCPTTEYDLTNSKHIGVYYSEWSYYNNFKLKDLAVENYTHIYYAFAGIKGFMRSQNQGYGFECANRDLYSILILDRFASLQSVQDSNDSYSNPLKGNLAELVRIKKKYPDKKIILSIGGWTLSDTFPYIVNSTCARKKFMDNLKAFLKVFTFFDGVDIDYEFPLIDGATKGLHKSLDEEPTNLVLFYSELRKMLLELELETNKQYELSTALGVSTKSLNYLDIRYIADITDSVNLMLYDFYGAWNNEIGFQAPIKQLSHLDRTRSLELVLTFLD